MVAQRFVGADNQSAALMQCHKRACRLDDCLRNGRALRYGVFDLLVRSRRRLHGAVIERVDLRHGRRDVRQGRRHLHALAHCAGNVFREQCRALGGGEKLLHGVAVRTAHTNAEAFKLSLVRVKPCKRCARVVLGAVQLLQNLCKILARHAVHAFFECNVFKCHCIIPFLKCGTRRRLPRSCLPSFPLPAAASQAFSAPPPLRAPPPFLPVLQCRATL